MHLWGDDLPGLGMSTHCDLPRHPCRPPSAPAPHLSQLPTHASPPSTPVPRGRVQSTHTWPGSTALLWPLPGHGPSLGTQDKREARGRGLRQSGAGQSSPGSPHTHTHPRPPPPGTVLTPSLCRELSTPDTSLLRPRLRPLPAPRGVRWAPALNSPTVTEALLPPPAGPLHPISRPPSLALSLSHPAGHPWSHRLLAPGRLHLTLASALCPLLAPPRRPGGPLARVTVCLLTLPWLTLLQRKNQRLPWLPHRLPPPCRAPPLPPGLPPAGPCPQRLCPPSAWLTPPPPVSAHRPATQQDVPDVSLSPSAAGFSSFTHPGP